jgi:hypothetical protein
MSLKIRKKMKTKIIIIITISLFNISLLNGQNWFKGSEWNYHFNRTTSFPQFRHLGTCKTEGDTLIENKSFSIIKSNDNEVDYLFEQDNIVYYYKEKQILTLFDFSKAVNDSFLIDMYFNYNQKDTVIKNVLVKIKSIDFIQSISTSDSLKSFKYNILSDNVKNVIGSNIFPFEVPNSVTEKLILTNLASYNVISLTQLYNSTVNLGMDSKPILSCFKNEISSFLFKDSFLVKNNFPCNYTSGIPISMSPLNFTFYPNPATTQLNITSNSNIKAISVYNITGQLTKELTYNNLKDVSLAIDNLAQGMYMLQIIDELGAKVTSKFIKE